MKKKLWFLLIIVPGVLLAVHLALFLIPYKPLKQFKEKPYSTVFYDCQGELLQVTSTGEGERREYSNWEEIPAEVKKIFRKAEDKRFYFHNGSDPAAFISAIVQNISQKKIVRGGSTITMQLVKIITGDKRNTFKRKLKDIFYAHVIEAKLSKKKIFELYLNSIYFGHGAYGIASAARTFYGCTIQELCPEQLCCLAVIPRNPTLYDPIKQRDRNTQMACALYNKLYHKKLTQEEFELFVPGELFEYPFEAPHYVRYVSQTISPKSHSFNLSINLKIQQYAQHMLSEGLSQAQDSRISNACLLLIENKTGTPLAWIGNTDFFDQNHSGQVDGVLVKNQPGSSMKPFLYALALESKDQNGQPLYMPSSILADIPQEFGDEKLYIPSNFNNRYNGPVTFRVALASSLNVPAVSILDKIGVDNYLNKLYELGFESLQKNGRQADLGLALGAGEVKLKELVNAFAVFARDGKDFDGNQIYRTDTARIIASILSDKASRALGFGYTQTFETDYPSIFKTGTSNQYQDIIALGATQNYTIGVWMGNFSGQTVMGKTGSSLPAWVAKKVLDFLEKGNNTQALAFPEPENYEKHRICSLSGMIAGPDCPAYVYEYFPKGYLEKPNRCTWHIKKADEVQTIYPPEYQQWARKTRPELQIKYNAAPLSIQTPRNNSIFYYSEFQKDKQALTVEVFGGAYDTLTVYYDDIFFDDINRPFTFLLPVERGNHTCSVLCGQESCIISYQVK